jgi:hypothetical protein
MQPTEPKPVNSVPKDHQFDESGNGSTVRSSIGSNFVTTLKKLVVSTPALALPSHGLGRHPAQMLDVPCRLMPIPGNEAGTGVAQLIGNSFVRNGVLDGTACPKVPKTIGRQVRVDAQVICQTPKIPGQGVPGPCSTVAVCENMILVGVPLPVKVSEESQQYGFQADKTRPTRDIRGLMFFHADDSQLKIDFRPAKFPHFARPRPATPKKKQRPAQRPRRRPHEHNVFTDRCRAPWCCGKFHALYLSIRGSRNKFLVLRPQKGSDHAGHDSFFRIVFPPLRIAIKPLGQIVFSAFGHHLMTVHSRELVQIAAQVLVGLRAKSPCFTAFLEMIQVKVNDLLNGEIVCHGRPPGVSMVARMPSSLGGSSSRRGISRTNQLNPVTVPCPEKSKSKYDISLKESGSA